jgi:hypothetical protein
MAPRALSDGADHRFFFGMHPALRSPRRLLGGLLAAAALACDDEPSGPTLQPVTSGTIGGLAFTVTGGTIYQVGADGPLYADDTGGQLLFDGGAAALGTSDADLLHVRSQFAIADGGSLQISAFGDAGSPFNTGIGIALIRGGTGIFYEFRFGGAVAADSTFVPEPQFPGAEQWVVTELYADSVPGYGAGQSGAAMWPLDDLTPAAGADVLGCVAGPATDPTPLAGDPVGYALDGAWLLAVDVVDQIVGPCT